MPNSPIPNSDALEAAEDAAYDAVMELCLLAPDGGNCNPVIGGHDVSTQTISWCLEVGLVQNERQASQEQLQAERACMLALLQLARPERLDAVEIGACVARTLARTAREVAEDLVGRLAMAALAGQLSEMAIGYIESYSGDSVVHKLSTGIRAPGGPAATMDLQSGAAHDDGRAHTQSRIGFLMCADKDLRASAVSPL